MATFFSSLFCKNEERGVRKVEKVFQEMFAELTLSSGLSFSRNLAEVSLSPESSSMQADSITYM